MELVYTVEKREKTILGLFLRRRGWQKALRTLIADLAGLCPFVSCLFIIGLAGAEYDYTPLLVGIAVTVALIAVFILIDRIFSSGPRRAYRQQKSHKVEYRLTDDTLSFTVGETSFSSPWNKVAKKFRIDSKAVYLYGDDIPFEAQCIPDWKGRGVGHNELVAALKKAGLKKKISFPLKCLIVLLSVLLALQIYIFIGGVEWSDWKIPDEAELRLEKRVVPDEDNAYIALMAITNLCTIVKYDAEVEDADGSSTRHISDREFVQYYSRPFDSDDREMRAAIATDPDSPKRAAKILSDNAKFFAAFRAALTRKDFKEPETPSPFSNGNPFMAELPCLRPIVDFSSLIRLKVKDEIDKGDLSAAAADIQDVSRLGRLLVTRIGPEPAAFVQFLVGGLIRKTMYAEMCDCIVTGKASDEMLEAFSRMVNEDDEASPADCARALKAEYERHFLFVDWFCDALHNSASYDEYIAIVCRNYDQDLCKQYMPFFCGRFFWNWPGLKRFTFHRREMKFLVAQVLRDLLARNDVENTLDAIPNPVEGKRFAAMILPNGYAKIWISTMTPGFGKLFIEHRLSCMRPKLVIAAEKWRRAHDGANPPTLEELVPEYLAEVPVDPWDKTSGRIKYDAELGVVWSIGEKGAYDYREAAKKIASGAADSSLEDETEKYAFRLDAKPLEFTTHAKNGNN